MVQHGQGWGREPEQSQRVMEGFLGEGISELGIKGIVSTHHYYIYRMLWSVGM